MSAQYKAGIYAGIVLGVAVYFLVVWALPILGRLNWMFI